MSNKDSLGDRIKKYENVSSFWLTPRSCVIIRIDGKAFHTFTRGYKKPFDSIITNSMDHASLRLFENVQGSKLVYTQSDEISLLITDFDTIDTQGWYGYNHSKIISISASLVTGYFIQQLIGSDLSFIDGFGKCPVFDSRAFVIPKDDVTNYFLWRIKDCRRNSINGFAQSIFSHKELQGKNCNQVLEMLKEKGIPWDKDSELISDRDRFGFMSTSEGRVEVYPEYKFMAKIIDPLNISQNNL